MLSALVLDKDMSSCSRPFCSSLQSSCEVSRTISSAPAISLSTGWKGKFYVLSLTAALLLAALPIAFRLRTRYAARTLGRLNRLLALKHPEQIFFFAPIVLVAFMIAVKMNPGMVTLSWGIEGVAVILLGLLVSERSYRLTGLFLLLLCVGKIVVRDAWLLGERDRYITFIVLGAALTLVSMLYGKYREAVRRLL